MLIVFYIAFTSLLLLGCKYNNKDDDKFVVHVNKLESTSIIWIGTR